MPDYVEILKLKKYICLQWKTVFVNPNINA